MKLHQSPDGIVRVYFDASSLRESACLRKFFWTAIVGYVKETMDLSFSLAYGNAVHKFLERLYIGVPVEENLRLTHDYYTPFNERLRYCEDEILTLRHLGETCKLYYKYYGNGKDNIEPLIIKNNNCVEQQFALPIWSGKVGSLEIEIILCGTIDLIGTFAKVECFVDHKTTSSYYKENYFKQFEFDIQMMLYSWALKKILGIDRFLPVVINGFFLKKPTIKSEKEGIFDGVRFERSRIIEFPDESMEEFESWLKRRIGELISFFKTEETINSMEKIFDMSLCRTYGLCKFFEICRLSPKNRLDMLKTNFLVKQYEPLKFRT